MWSHLASFIQPSYDTALVADGFRISVSSSSSKQPHRTSQHRTIHSPPPGDLIVDQEDQPDVSFMASIIKLTTQIKPMMLSRHIFRPAAQGVTRSAFISSSSRALNKVPTPTMETPEKKPDSVSSGNDKPKDLNLDNQSLKDNISSEELKAQAEHAKNDKTKNDGIYKRTGQ